MAYFSRPEDNTRKRSAYNNQINEQSKLSDLDSSDKLTDSSDEVHLKNKKDLKVKIGLPDLDFNDPNFLKILKEYEKYDENDDEEIIHNYDHNPSDRQLFIKPKKKSWCLEQGLGLLTLVVGVVAIVVLINWWNLKELQSLKETYFLEDRVESLEEWWRKGLVYRIVVPTFADSNADGVGDLRGVMDKVDYLKDIGVDVILLSWMMDFHSEDYQNDQDNTRDDVDKIVGVVNFTNIHSKVGNLYLFKALLEKFHSKGLKVMMELVINHSSDQHPWFELSSALNHPSHRSSNHIDEKYKNYYVWSEGKSINGNSQPPNKWKTSSGKAAWTNRGSLYYYHFFHHTLPDLNFRSPHVRQEIQKILEFWLDRGVDGFLLDSVPMLFESPDITGHDDDEEHSHTLDQPDLHLFLGFLNELVQAYAYKNQRKIAFYINYPLTHDLFSSETSNIYQRATRGNVDSIKNFHSWIDTPISHILMNIQNVMHINHSSSNNDKVKTDLNKPQSFVEDTKEVNKGVALHNMIDSWMAVVEQKDTLWLAGHDSRSLHKDHHTAKAYHYSLYTMLLSLLPGSVLYNQANEFSSFSSHTEELYKIRNKVLFPNSISTSEPSNAMQLFRAISRLRREKAFMLGDFNFAIVNKNIFSFIRSCREATPYLVSINVGTASSTDNYHHSAGVTWGKVVVHVPSAEDHEASISNNDSMKNEYEIGSLVRLDKVRLKPGEGLVMILMLDDLTL